MKPIPGRNSPQASALPVKSLQVLRVDDANVPRRKITVIQRGANRLSDQGLLQHRPMFQVPASSCQPAPERQGFNGNGRIRIKPGMKKMFHSGVITRTFAGEIIRGKG
ncbi:MAG: hypothetical protein WCH99_13535 [Verrucomicrobiota bacterium]